MARTIWKFEVLIGEVHGDPDSLIPMPRDAEVISVGTQGAKVLIWVLADPLAPVAPRRFGYFATGSEIPDGWSYVGSAHVPAERAMLGSAYVWHIFEDGAWHELA